MQWQDVETALARLEPPFPRAAAEEARRRWEEWAPHFVAAIERVADGGSIFRDAAEEDYDGRDELLAYLDTFCEREAGVMRRDEWDFEREPCDLLSWAADAACDIGPAPLLDKVRGWMAEGLIDPTVTGIEWFEKNAAKSATDCLAEAAEDKNNRYIQDGLAMLEQWICFDESADATPADANDAPPLWPAQPVRHVDTIVREAPKVGRNDPCPAVPARSSRNAAARPATNPPPEMTMPVPGAGLATDPAWEGRCGRYQPDDHPES